MSETPWKKIRAENYIQFRRKAKESSLAGAQERELAEIGFPQLHPIKSQFSPHRNGR
jgi:hypothetical protein